ncbi:hypothetical protein [Chelativorans sp. AA-79]|uniref:hypothetical protein n=1 Tax=Chelativorans sp. AA-79 TaxID=3028735 RepID=UPI0023F641E6|nr:hypothetical protein [Chelativorans sp. AA-79]WEX07703.1 hypothetical protein PVE73_16520 [Chelativorans sp. AA-79]
MTNNLNLAELFHLMARAAMVLSVLALPLMLMGGADGAGGGLYEKKTAGAGFVLLVSLQRSR